MKCKGGPELVFDLANSSVHGDPIQSDSDEASPPCQQAKGFFAALSWEHIVLNRSRTPIAELDGLSSLRGGILESLFHFVQKKVQAD
jgi:hypothetical protein